VRVLAQIGAHQELQIVLILVAAAALLLLADPRRVPYPILLVVGGLALGFLPGVPTLVMPPDVVLAGILPPLLYSAAFNTGLRELRQNLRPISMLAIGLVSATTVFVAALAHYTIDLPWAAGFVLGAVVSPTDPLAASAIGRRLGVPRRPLAIIEGESLVNDGTALVLFKFAVAAVTTGSFSLWHAGLDFVWTVAGGIVVGLALGHVIRLVRRRLDNPPLEVMVAFLTGYFTYLPASALGVSGVLAVVTAGVYMGWHTPELTTVDTRLQGNAFWSIFNFFSNALLFGLVGLQLQPILDALSGYSTAQLIAYGALVTGVVVATRIVWVVPLTYLPRLLSQRIREKDPYPPWQQPAFVCWTGMRGAVTIAAALAIPLHTANRELIVFLAFCVVFGTLVVQGLSMPAFIRLLGLEDDGLDVKEDAKARIRAAEAALERLEELVEEEWVRDDTAERMRGTYRFRINRFKEPYKGGDGSVEQRSRDYQRLRRELLEAERRRIVELRNEGVISSEVMRRVERDLDLEAARLDV
jgi:CPA1 family monovalent cation:H+ antiporter